MRCKSMVVLLVALITPLAAQAEKVNLTIPIRVPFQEGLNVSNAVLNECELERKLSKFLVKETKRRYNKVIAIPAVTAETPGHVLDIHITQVLAPGGGKWSGPKVVATQGTLYDNGKVLGTFAAKRHTTKGRHTCGMLEQNARAIAEDIADWMKKPTMDAKLGDAK
jgi:hypothetical protein